MKRIRFTEEQIIAVLREHEAGAKTADLARKHGISEATLHNWKAGDERFRQWHRVHLECNPELGKGASGGITSRQEGRCRTVISNRSLAGCATSFSMRACSSISTRPASSSVPGIPTTTPRGRSSLGYKTPAAYAGTLTAPQGITLAETLIAAG